MEERNRPSATSSGSTVPRISSRSQSHAWRRAAVANAIAPLVAVSADAGEEVGIVSVGVCRRILGRRGVLLCGTAVAGPVVHRHASVPLSPLRPPSALAQDRRPLALDLAPC